MQQLQLQEAHPTHPTPQPPQRRTTAQPTPTPQRAAHRATPQPPPHRPTPPQPLQPPPQPRPHRWAYCRPSFDEAVASRSYTKNLERVTSESSSSPRVITGRVFCGAVFAPSTTAADALPAIAKDMPAAPHIGNAGPERFRFEACFVRAMADLPCP